MLQEEHLEKTCRKLKLSIPTGGLSSEFCVGPTSNETSSSDFDEKDYALLVPLESYQLSNSLNRSWSCCLHGLSGCD